MDKLLRILRLSALRSALVKAWPGPRILYIWDPRFVDYVGKLGEDLVCYHVYDNQSGFADGDWSRNLIIDQENRLLNRADLIVASHRILIELHGVEEKAVYCPAGVSESFVQRLQAPGCNEPLDLPKGKPRIGYTGAINKKFDLDILEAVADRNHVWDIVLVGEVGLKGGRLRQLQRLMMRPNIHVLGFKPWDQMPRYISAFDVGMLCYRETEWTRFCEIPLKLFEYFAAGKPVVASGLPDLRTLGGLVRFSKDPEEFCQNIERALAEDTERDKAKRIAVALENTWDRRADTVMDAIRRALEERSQARLRP